MNTSSEAFLTTVALSFAPLSVISPVGGLAIAFSALLARFGCVMGLREPNQVWPTVFTTVMKT